MDTRIRSGMRYKAFCKSGYYTRALSYLTSTLFALYVLNSQAQSVPSVQRYVVNGDVNKDRITGLVDLAQLGKDWDSALDKYGLRNTTILADMSSSWREPVQATLASQAEFASFGTEAIANLDPSTKALSPAMRKWYERALEKANLDTKGIEGALAIGFAVDMPVQGQPIVTPREQVFNLLDSEGNTILLSNRTFSQVPRGGFIDESTALGVGIPRYDVAQFNADFPLESTEFKFDSIESAFEEASTLGLDLGVAARFAAFSGSLDLGIDNSYYADRRNFKVVLIIRQSFGWRYAPSDAIEANLTENFRARREAALIDTDIDLTQEYGTFVAVADHPVRSLVITIDVKTEKEEDREEISARLKASFSAFGSERYRLDSGLETMSSSSSEIRDIEVNVDVIGGPALLDLDPESNDDPLVSAQALALEIANDASLGISVDERFEKLVNAWIAAGNITNAVPVDFIYSPIANFQRVDRNPLTKGASMRAWFKRYLDADEALSRANLILTSINRVPVEGALPEPENIRLRDDYSYLATLSPFSAPNTPGGANTYGSFPTYAEYAANQYLDTAQLYFDLFEKGKAIASSTTEDPVLFRSNEPFFLVPEFTAPTFTISLGFLGGDKTFAAGIGCNGTANDPTFCGQCLEGRYEFRVNGLELRGQSRYKLIYSFNTGSTNTALQGCGDGINGQGGMAFYQRSSTSDAYRATRFARGRDNNCVIGCWGFWDWAYIDFGGNGLRIGLLDTTLNRVVYGSEPGGELTKTQREELNVAGFQLNSEL